MMSGKLRLIILLFMVLVCVCGDSEGEDKPCPDPDDPNMVQCTNTNIEGKDGDTVILPCSTKDKTDISHEEVEWSIKDPADGKKFVHLYFQGEDFLHKQSDKFKDRTSLSKEELSSGNCSLSLLVTTSHSGRYYCCVGGILHCTVNLKVLPKGTNVTSQKHQNVPESPDKPNNGLTTTQKDNVAVVGAVIGVLAALFALGVYCYRKHLHPQRNPSNPSNGQELPVLAQQPPQNQEKKPLDQNLNEEQIILKVVVD